MTPRRLAFFVGILALLAHARAKWGDFVFHDDYRYVVNNEAIERVGDPLRFFTDLSTLATESPTKDIYRPVRTLSYAVITSLWGKESAAPFHAAAVVLHASTAALLGLLLLRAGLAWPGAAAGALFFGLHPVTVEVTAWVCSLGDAWCGFFAVASVLAYAADKRILALLALVLALFSKEHAVVVPGIWILWDAFLRRDRLRAGRWLRTLGLGAAPAAAVVLLFLLFRAGVVGARTSQVDEPIGGSYASAVCTMTAGLGWYAATILFPYGPTFDAVVDVRETPFDLGVLTGLLVLAALVWAVARGNARARLGAAWFLVALVPVHNVLVPLKIPTADRFLYLPLMGLALVAGELSQRVSARCVVPVLALLGLLSATRIGDWRDDETLLEAGRRVAPKSHRILWAEAFVLANKAGAYLQHGDLTSGERLAARAVEQYQRYLVNSVPGEQTQVFVELGNLFFAMGEARARYVPGARREAQSRALEAYVAARRLQREGVGRTTEEQVALVATRIVQLATDLAEPQNPNVGATIEAGLEAAAFLKASYGVDDTPARVVFRLADSVRVRGNEPAKAREGFNWVLETIGRLEAQGARHPFLRAQALYYRAVLRDQDPNRTDLELAYHTYVEAANAAKARTGWAADAARLRAFAYAARCACTIGDLFGDAKWTELGKGMLERLPALAAQERRRLDDELRNEIASLEAGCGR